MILDGYMRCMYIHIYIYMYLSCIYIYIIAKVGQSISYETVLFLKCTLSIRRSMFNFGADFFTITLNFKHTYSLSCL